MRADVGVQARFLDEPTFANDRVRLIVRDRTWGEVRFLATDGSWQPATPGEVVAPVRLGIDLPREAVEAIAEACEQFLGHSSHGATEARVLREALQVERDRVDRVLAVPRG
jgi:hypothetical protein